MTVIHMPGAALRRRKPAIPSPMLGTLILVVTEVMFFCALISAFNVIKAQTFGGTWAPPGDVRLPVAATALNTVVLLVSGALMFIATRSYAKEETRPRAKTLFFQAILLGSFFVLFQGYEWIKLIRYGMTMTSSVFGATFFMLIGSHGLHVLVAVLAMIALYTRLLKGKLSVDGMRAMEVFWLFVVGVWPVLYGLVYFA